MPIDNFGNLHILLVTENQAHAHQMVKKFERAGGPGISVETSISNVVNQLQNKDINVCYIDFDSIAKIDRVITAVRNNNIAGQLPIVVFTEKIIDELFIKSLYELGTNFVVEGLTEGEINYSYWVIDSLLRLLDKFKVGAGRNFR